MEIIGPPEDIRDLTKRCERLSTEIIEKFSTFPTPVVVMVMASAVAAYIHSGLITRKDFDALVNEFRGKLTEHTRRH